jgi:hypothetical protein
MALDPGWRPRKRASKGTKAKSLDEQYTDAAGSVAPPTQDQIEAQQEKIEGYFRKVVDRANANLMPVVCPGCGSDFSVERG